MTVDSQLGSISAIIHYTDNLPYSDNNFVKSAKSLLYQFGYAVKLIILDSSKDAKAEIKIPTTTIV